MDKAAREFTGGRGVDQVLEVGGVATLTRSFNAIRIGGKISIIGSVSGGATELNPSLISSDAPMCRAFPSARPRCSRR